MAKDPVFPLYYNDIDRSTKTWTDEEFGAYMRLLMEQWDKGGLPKDYQRLTRIATSLDKNWPMLKEKFTEVDGQLKNLVLEDIRAKKLKHKQKQSENVRKRYQTPYQTPTKNLPLEIEKENEKEIVNVLENIKEQVGTNYVTIANEIVDHERELTFFEAQLNGAQKEYSLPAWQPLINSWFLEHLQENFKDNTHLKNSFKKWYINRQRPWLKPRAESFKLKDI